MNHEEYFPRGMAIGEAFCNRVNERSRLSKNVQTGQHTLIMSPRRYGKTSLVFYVANELQVPFGDVDLFVAIDARKIEQMIIAGIKKIMLSIGTSTEQVLEMLRSYFKDKSSQWTIGTQGINLALVPAYDRDPAINVLEALQALEDLLQKKKKKAVLFLDEIQEIGEIAEGKGIEGAIRHIAQKTRFLSLIFSGSNRHLLSKMFYDRSRPLYKLCDRIALERINEFEYTEHINKIAVKKWGKKIDYEVLKMIFTVTELHSYYVNNLCLRLWERKDKELPKTSDVTHCWNEIINEGKQEILRELTTLNISQRKVLGVVARDFSTALTSKQTLRALNLASSSVIEAIRVLEQGDYLERLEDKKYRIVDPLLKATLLFHYDNF